MADDVSKVPKQNEDGIPTVILPPEEEEALKRDIRSLCENLTIIDTATGETILREGEEDPLKQLPPEREKALRRAFQGLPPE